MEQSDYLYINKDDLITIKLYTCGYSERGNYIITGLPKQINGNYRVTIRYIDEILPKNYERENVIPRKDISFYLSKDVSYLGGGLYGKVYKSGNYAIKTFETDIKHGTPYLDSSYLRETATLLRISHPNITGLIDIVEGSPTEIGPFSSNQKGPERLSIILPLATMNLHAYIQKYGLIHSKFITYQILKGFNYLQNKDIIHGDIKPDNILMFVKDDKTFEVKISDFGISTHTSCQPSNLLSQAYNAYYRPIEIILSVGYGLAADIWALACMIYTIYTGKYLFYHPNDDIQLNHINTLPAPEKQKELANFNEDLPVKILERMVRILGNPLREWPELIDLLEDRYSLLSKRYSPERVNQLRLENDFIFRQSEYNPQIIRANLNDDDMYEILLAMLKYNPNDRLRLNEIIIDKYFSNIPGYSALTENVLCDDVLDRRQHYPRIQPVINNYKNIRKECFDYIKQHINKYKFDTLDYFMICYIFDACYNVAVESNYINFTIACISIWSCFKYGEARGIPTIDKYPKLPAGQILALGKVSEYSRMIICILNNDLTVTTILDYILSNNRNKEKEFIDLLMQSIETDAPFKNLAIDIFTAMDIYFYERKYIDIINSVITQLKS